MVEQQNTKGKTCELINVSLEEIINEIKKNYVLYQTYDCFDNSVWYRNKDSKLNCNAVGTDRMKLFVNTFNKLCNQKMNALIRKFGYAMMLCKNKTEIIKKFDEILGYKAHEKKNG